MNKDGKYNNKNAKKVKQNKIDKKKWKQILTTIITPKPRQRQRHH